MHEAVEQRMREMAYFLNALRKCQVFPTERLRRSIFVCNVSFLSSLLCRSSRYLRYNRNYEDAASFCVSQVIEFWGQNQLDFSGIYYILPIFCILWKLYLMKSENLGMVLGDKMSEYWSFHKKSTVKVIYLHSLCWY